MRRVLAVTTLVLATSLACGGGSADTAQALDGLPKPGNVEVAPPVAHGAPAGVTGTGTADDPFRAPATCTKDEDCTDGMWCGENHVSACDGGAKAGLECVDDAACEGGTCKHTVTSSCIGGGF